jgi:cell division protein FtsW
MTRNKSFKKPANKNGAPYLIGDVMLLFPVLLLTGIGIVMIYSASSEIALKKFGNGYYFFERQLCFALPGLFALIVCRYVPYKWLRSLAYVFLTAALVLLVAVQIKGIGYAAGGATRWLRIKGFSFQPSEFARFAMIIYLAYSLSKKRDRIEDPFIGFLPHFVVLTGFAGLLLAQPDFGSVLILAAITWIMMFAGGVRPLHLFSSMFGVVLVLSVLMVNAEYRIKRLTTFLDPWQSPTGEGYQIIHSLMAFGTGGLWGTGVGKGYQKLFYLPEPHTDFIFSVIGEELGLWGVLLILVLYFIMLWRGISIAMNAKDHFSSLLAIGLIASIGLQVCINMGVTLGLLPTKGLTLPFLSYGGTSLLFNMISIGILMNIGASQTRA